MFCSNCGTEIKKGLSYCSSCGGRVSDVEKERSFGKFESVTTAIGFVAIGGIAGFVFLIKMLLENDVHEPVIVMLSLALLATIFGITYLLISLLSGKSDAQSRNSEFQNEIPRAIKSVDTNRLEEPKQAPASVIENTTRTLEKTPIERK